MARAAARTEYCIDGTYQVRQYFVNYVDNNGHCDEDMPKGSGPTRGRLGAWPGSTRSQVLAEPRVGEAGRCREPQLP